VKSICIVIFSLYSAILLTNCQGQQSSDVPIRPNILWIVCEDQSPQFFPEYGDSIVSLPTLASLASDGLVFDRAYATVPVCAPARSSIITGMYPTTLGTHNMRTYNAYKANNEESIGIPSYSPVVPENVRPFTEYLRESGYYCTNNAKEDYNFRIPPSAWDESSNKAHWRNRAEGQPFFSVFNIGITHESQIWNQGDKELTVDPASVPVPPYFPDDPIIRHDLAVNYSNLVRMDRQIKEIVDQLKEDGLFENTVIIFYGDHGGPFPRHKRVLYETGVQVPMIVRFPEGANAGRTDMLMSFIDLAPTVLSLAGIDPPGYIQGKALFGAYKDPQPREYLFTTSDRFDEVYDRVRAVRNGRYKYIRNYKTNLPYALPVSYREQMPMMQRLRELNNEGSLTPESQLWMNDTRPTEEFYDLANDPWELNNLIDHPDLRAEITELRQALSGWIDETNDLGGVDERQLIDQWTVDGRQVPLEPVQVELKGDMITASHKRQDATIVYRSGPSGQWLIYTGSIEKKNSLVFKAMRIGFEDSEEVTLE
jgi:arylsulfatase A-like enzyme